MHFHIKNICIKHVKHHKYHEINVHFDFCGVNCVTGYVLDSDFCVVGQFKNKTKGFVKIITKNLGMFKLYVVDSNNVCNKKKIKFDINN